MSLRYSALLALACVAASAGLAHARGSLAGVVSSPPGDACAHGPSGLTDHFWEVEAGKTYVCTIAGVTDCANGGTDATIGIRVNATGPGAIDLVASKVQTGEYTFTITIPTDNPSCTLPVFYCTPAGASDPGLRVLRTDGQYPAHFRIATFPGGVCSNPLFPDCATTPARSRTWAQVKQIYR